jgi:xanthine dehydrogenase molybdenum-binding subunit
MSEKLKYVGGTYPNHDAGPKVTGALVYASDLKLPNMLHAKLLLSPIAHGLVKSIDASKAEAVNQALGTSLSDLPLTPGKVLAAIKRVSPDQGL